MMQSKHATDLKSSETVGAVLLSCKSPFVPSLATLSLLDKVQPLTALTGPPPPQPPPPPSPPMVQPPQPPSLPVVQPPQPPSLLEVTLPQPLPPPILVAHHFDGVSSGGVSEVSVCRAIHDRVLHKDVAEKAYSQVNRNCLFPSLDVENAKSEVCGYRFLSVYNPCAPMIQNGPRCGLVALVMAAELLGHQLSPDMVYQEAKTRGFTQQGEMFSVDNLADLCEGVSEIQASVIDLVQDRCDLLAALLRGNPVLVPYDADKNHQPCQKRGHKAHWTVLTGLFMKIPLDTIEHLMKSEGITVVESDSFEALYLTDPVKGTAVELLKGAASRCNPEELFVYGHQGKSRHTALWLLSDLIRSNGNLVEVDPDKLTNPQEWVLPDGGLEEGLKDKGIVLQLR